MKSDGQDNAPNLVQVDTKNRRARQGGSISTNTENQQRSPTQKTNKGVY